MKRILCLLTLLTAIAVPGRAATRYLVNTASPVASYMYDAYRYAGPNSKKMNLSGGLQWQGGFTIGASQAPYKPGYATFRLGGAYETLLFVLGRVDDPESLDYEPCIVTVYADGRKIADEIVRRFGVPKRMQLDIKGVDELKFVLVQGEDRIGFAEATLWKAGETPEETGNLLTGPPKVTRLVQDLKPYAQYNHFCVSPDGPYKTVLVNGQKYHYGFFCNMQMAFIGVQPGASYFNLRGQYETLSLLAGPVDNGKSSGGKGWITIRADGKIIHEYEVSQDDIAHRIVLNVKGCNQLSFHTEQADQNLYAAIVDATLYPEGTFVADEHAEAEPAPDPRLKELPDVCKLISNIPPYAVGGQISHQVYDGASDHITFSMGGTRFSEGFILYEKADFWNDNTISYAVFDLGREFDFVSFTAGYVGKSWAMTNDVIRVYADDELLLEAPMMATYPNQHFVLPINRCRKLRFENGGSGNLNVGAYGIADVVVYRGEPVANDLFVHPEPECPPEIDLIDLGAPYLHYVSTKADSREEIFHDGSTLRRYFEMPDGRRINKGFILQTSVHFSLDHDVLSGSDNAAVGAIGGAAVGSTFVASGAAVGGAVVGSTLIGAASLLMLAAGGNAVENSCAAFNTYGKYNSVTFTVACLRPFAEEPSDYKETLLIGADQKVVAQLTVYETMEPQTVTVPIDGCRQLMFWLANTYNTSGQFVFYDIHLTREHLPLSLPKEARLSESIVTEPLHTDKTLSIRWKRPEFSGSQSVDSYISNSTTAYSNTVRLIEDTDPAYKIYTTYLETASGDVCKAISIRIDDAERLNNGDYIDFVQEYQSCLEELKRLRELNIDLTNLNLAYVNANLGLPELGFRAIAYGKVLKTCRKMVRECQAAVKSMIGEKQAETAVLESWIGSSMEVDGIASTRYTLICPLMPGEVPPTDQLQLLSRFNVR